MHSTCNLDEGISQKKQIVYGNVKTEEADHSRNNNQPWQRQVTDDESRKMQEILWNTLTVIKTWISHNFKESYSWCLTFCVLERKRAVKYLSMLCFSLVHYNHHPKEC